MNRARTASLRKPGSRETLLELVLEDELELEDDVAGPLARSTVVETADSEMGTTALTLILADAS
jgi:hypothetical protein